MCRCKRYFTQPERVTESTVSVILYRRPVLWSIVVRAGQGRPSAETAMTGYEYVDSAVASRIGLALPQTRIGLQYIRRMCHSAE